MDKKEFKDRCKCKQNMLSLVIKMDYEESKHCRKKYTLT